MPLVHPDPSQHCPGQLARSVIDKCDLKDAIVVLRPSTDDSLRTLDLKVIEHADFKRGFYKANDPANLTIASCT